MNIYSTKRRGLLYAATFSIAAFGVFLCLMQFRPSNLNRFGFVFFMFLTFIAFGCYLARKSQTFSFVLMSKVVFGTFIATTCVIAGFIYMIWPKQRLPIGPDGVGIDFVLLIFSASFFSWSWLASLLAYLITTLFRFDTKQTRFKGDKAVK